MNSQPDQGKVQYALAVVGRDRPGIAAALAAVLHRAGANIEDSRMTILGGQFAVMMLLSLPSGSDVEAVRRDLASVRDELSLNTAVLEVVPATTTQARPEPTHILTVYGGDHPGIVHAVCERLAERKVNIDDLATRVIGATDAPVYTMICEVTLPPGLDHAAITDELAEVAASEGVEVVLRELDQDIL